jgi:hypothetical protein
LSYGPSVSSVVLAGTPLFVRNGIERMPEAVERTSRNFPTDALTLLPDRTLFDSGFFHDTPNAIDKPDFPALVLPYRVGNTGAFGLSSIGNFIM